MKRAQLVLLATLVAGLLTPSQAHALAGWWDRLDKLSGPGPFNNGWVFDWRLACKVRTSTKVVDAAGEQAEWIPVWRGDADAWGCLTSSNSVRGYFEVRGGRITSDNQPLFSDTSGELVGTVAANAIQGFFMRQFDPALAIGAGAGVIWFSGDNVEGQPGRFALTPISVAFMPLKLILRGPAKKAGFITIRVEETAILGGFKATDFNRASTSSFRSSSELLRSVSVTFDVLALLAKE